ncbi:MAG: nucleoside hydrolase [Acidobacteria bacterium]|nr:nucleoside hydrolase [Acidobacteriota bacterium]
MRVLALVAVFAALAAAAGPVPVIFDTDMGNDIDDALALAILHALESRGECRIVAVTLTKEHPLAAPFCDLVNHFYRRPGIPIGVVKNGKTPEDSAYLRAVCERKLYPRRIEDGRQAPEATAVLRRALAAEKDASVAVVQVGFSTNLARLLASEPELVRRKVRLLSVMAGNFRDPKFAEYNVETDVPSARKVFSEWPGAVVFSGFEVGQSMRVPARSIETDYGWTAHHPVVDGYRAYKKPPYDSPTWDPTAALYAVRPEHGYFSLSAPGWVRVDEAGRTRHEPAADGRHRYLIVDGAQRARTLEAMTILASQPVLN